MRREEEREAKINEKEREKEEEKRIELIAKTNEGENSRGDKGGLVKRLGCGSVEQMRVLDGGQ